jgi:Cu/Ag efflux protein CusF
MLRQPHRGQADVLTAGEITRVDARTGKLTIRHEEIKNLDMPPMTMVFALSGSASRPLSRPVTRCCSMPRTRMAR